MNESEQRIRGGHARAAPDVVVVEEDAEQPYLVARGFGFLVVVGANLTRRLFDRFLDAAVQLHELERLDLLRLVILGHFEVGRLQIRHRIAGLVGMR